MMPLIVDRCVVQVSDSTSNATGLQSMDVAFDFHLLFSCPIARVDGEENSMRLPRWKLTGGNIIIPSHWKEAERRFADP